MVFFKFNCELDIWMSGVEILQKVKVMEMVINTAVFITVTMYRAGVYNAKRSSSIIEVRYIGGKNNLPT